jgi:hypothetical protein
MQEDWARQRARSSPPERDIDHIRVGILRFAPASRTVLCWKTLGGIRIMRMLHTRMDPERHL